MPQNLPGFGASDPVELNSVGEHADHVARVMDALSLPPTVDVFGNGFGAFVASLLDGAEVPQRGKQVEEHALHVPPLRQPDDGLDA